MKKQVCVIGLGQFGTHLAQTLVKLRCEVLAIDADEQRVNAIRDEVHRAIIGDARDQEMLASVVTADVPEAVICLGQANVEASILCALNLKRIGIRSIRSTAVNDDHAQILLAWVPQRSSSRSAARRKGWPGESPTLTFRTCSR